MLVQPKYYDRHGLLREGSIRGGRLLVMPRYHKPLPAAEVIRERLHYNKSTGYFTWKVKFGRRRDPAGGVAPNGYRRILVEGDHYYAHRLAWLWVTGKDPGILEIDHRNHCPDDNRWKNIRIAKHDGNQRNARLQRNNKSGVKGVSWCNYYQRWIGQVSIGPRHCPKVVRVKLCKTLEETAEAVRLLRIKVHGKRFTNHG